MTVSNQPDSTQRQRSGTACGTEAIIHKNAIDIVKFGQNA